MEQVFIGFGSNLGNKLANIQSAIGLIAESLGQIIQESSLYETAPWGYESSELFLNGVIEITTKLSAQELLKGLKEIEITLGRKDKTISLYSDRLIDLDILYFGTKIVTQLGLEIPHPRIYDRRFVLEPLSEIAPNFIDSSVNKTVKQLLIDCLDTSILKKIVN